MAQARRLVRRDFGRDHAPLARALARVFAATVWPPAILVHLWQIRRHRGAAAVPTRRMTGAIWAALRHNVLPGEYFAYQLWLPGRMARVDEYLYCHEAFRLFGLLNQPPHPDPINDKLAFNTLCRQLGIPTPDVIAVINADGSGIDFDEVPPRIDLFIKPRHGNSGRSGEALRWDGAQYSSSRHVQIPSGEIWSYLARRAKDEERALLVQPLLRNHPSVRVKDANTLEPARLVTGLLADGTVTAIFGAFYRDRQNDAAALSSRADLIDLRSGRLVSGTGDGDWVLPNWHKAVQTALLAHRALPGFVFIGWDIALTDQGNLLLEGNANWCADEFQVGGHPLGNTPFSDILTGHFRRRPELT